MKIKAIAKATLGTCAVLAGLPVAVVIMGVVMVGVGMATVPFFGWPTDMYSGDWILDYAELFFRGTFMFFGCLLVVGLFVGIYSEVSQ